MGRPIADHLLRAGYRVVGFDLSEPARSAHSAAGGEIALSAGAIADVAKVIITSLPHVAALDAVLHELSTVGRPPVIIETSTLTIGEKHTARDIAASSGIVLIDCPLSGTSAQAAKGDLVAYLSADGDTVLNEVRQIVAAFTRAVYEVGAFGNGTKMKLVANTLVAIHNLAAAEALLLAQRSGLDAAAALAALQDGAGGSKMLQVRGPLMLSSTYEPAMASVDIFVKDLGAIRNLAAVSGTPMPLIETTSVIYDEAAAQGRGVEDAASVMEVLRGLPVDKTPAQQESADK